MKLFQRLGIDTVQLVIGLPICKSPLERYRTTLNVRCLSFLGGYTIDVDSVRLLLTIRRSMTITRRDSSYQVYVCRGARRWRKSVATEQLARLLEAEWRLALLQGREPVIESDEEVSEESTDSSLGCMAERTFNLYWEGTKGAKTARSNINDIVRLVGDDLCITKLDQRVVNDLLSELRARELSPASINRKMAALGKVLSLAFEEGTIEKRPKLPRLKENNQRTKCFTQEELDSIYTHMETNGHNDVADFCRWLVETGMRVSEARRISWENSGMRDGVSRVYHTKTGDPRSLPLTSTARDLLCKRHERQVAMKQSLLDATPWESVSQSRLTYVWNQARENLGMTDPDCVPHSLRHTCASRLARSGVDLLSIKEWLGHRTLAMTLRYSHLSKNQLQSAKQALEVWSDE